MDKEIIGSIEKSFGLSIDEISRMDTDEITEHIRKKTGEKVIFSTVRDDRMASRGNPLLFVRRYVTEKLLMSDLQMCASENRCELFKIAKTRILKVYSKELKDDYFTY
jgi:hypothetical protein